MELLRKPVSIVWAALMLATCASTWLLSKNSVTPEVATVAIMLIAAVKVRLVIKYFMEVRRAPLALRLVCDGWLLAVTALIIDRLPGLIRRTAVGVPPAQADQTHVTAGSGCTKEMAYVCAAIGLHCRCVSALRSML